MTLNETIMQLVMLAEHPAMPKGFQPILDKIIEALSELEPESQWTPCSEGLPEEDHQLGGSGKQFSDNVLVSIVNRDDEDAWLYVSHTIDGEWALDLSRYCKVLAWMPLPEPYQPEEESE